MTLCIVCVRIHAVSIGIPVDSCYKLVDDHIKELGLIDINARDIVDLIDGYIGLSYGKSTKEEMGKYRVIRGSFCPYSSVKYNTF